MAAIAGFIVSYKTHREANLLMFGILAYYTLIHMVLFATVRYRFPIETLLITMSGYSMAAAKRKLLLK